MKEMKINAIKKGTVIDHIPSEYTFKVAEILNISDMRNTATIGANLESKKMGSKGIIKVGGLRLDETDVQKIALIAPSATLCIIEDFKVVEKIKLKIPDRISGIAKCFNPDCITNHERTTTEFDVISKSPIKLRCIYCERIMDADHTEML